MTERGTSGRTTPPLQRRARRPRARPPRALRPRLLAAALLPVLVLLIVRGWLVESLTVSSDSMEPTIPAGSVVLVYKPAAAADHIPAGAVVAFTNPTDGRKAIKRVVAGAGQTVAIRDAKLYVDGVAAREPFVDHDRIDATYFGPESVPPRSVFVLGDNRSVSIDSRHFGAVPLDAIQGTVVMDRK